MLTVFSCDFIHGFLCSTFKIQVIFSQSISIHGAEEVRCTDTFNMSRDVRLDGLFSHQPRLVSLILLCFDEVEIDIS